MGGFKRNQVEEAVARMFDPNAGKPSPELRMKIKRLLQADRDLGRRKGHSNPERANYAFYSSEPPGTGSDIGFSDYDAFALLTGLRILDHGWPQGTVVSDLRKARPRLEKEHTGILQRELVPVDLAVAAKTARPGEMAVYHTDPVYLCIISGPAEPGRSRSRSVEICRGEPELMKVMLRELGQSSSVFELAATAHRLRDLLSRTTPRRRGRGSA
jgi:hypothetical protein